MRYFLTGVLFSFVVVAAIIYMSRQEKALKVSYSSETLDLKKLPKKVKQKTKEKVVATQVVNLKKTLNTFKVVKLDRKTIYLRGNKRKEVSFIREGDYAVTQGDILLGSLKGKKEQVGFLRLAPLRTWQNNTLSYFITEGVEQKELIELALSEIEEKTNLVFERLFSAQDFPEDLVVVIRGDKGCFSALGRVGGQQPISLSPKCGKKAIKHEFMHALGFAHEQSRLDRDQYVKIHWNNIEQGKESQFYILPENMLNKAQKNFDFDYNSIMLYPPLIFSENGRDTISSVGDEKINPQNALSREDVAKINYLYP